LLATALHAGAAAFEGPGSADQVPDLFLLSIGQNRLHPGLHVLGEGLTGRSAGLALTFCLVRFELAGHHLRPELCHVRQLGRPVLDDLAANGIELPDLILGEIQALT